MAPSPQARKSITQDPRVDAYIECAAPFAQPILRQLSDMVHAPCLQVEESIRWSMLSFIYAGTILGQMAAPSGKRSLRSSKCRFANASRPRFAPVV